MTLTLALKSAQWTRAHSRSKSFGEMSQDLQSWPAKFFIPEYFTCKSFFDNTLQGRGPGYLRLKLFA